MAGVDDPIRRSLEFNCTELFVFYYFLLFYVLCWVVVSFDLVINIFEEVIKVEAYVE